MDMKMWIWQQIKANEKTPMPVVSFPAARLLGYTVKDFVSDSIKQAEGILLLSETLPAAAAMSPMDLSVEAECFGSEIRFSDSEVPTVVGRIVKDDDDADRLVVPKIGSGRTKVYLESIRIVSRKVKKPLFAGVIGPYSLAGRLMDVSEIMVLCYENPELVEKVLKKTTEFIISYALAFKKAGANGVILAEPLTGMLSPALAEEFSAPYVRQIVEAVQDDTFLLIYHNCGNNTIRMIDSILSVGAAGYHFGNAISMEEMLPHIPETIPVFGNIDPAGQIKNGTPESVRESVKALLHACADYPNLILSTGCDIPPAADIENILAFFEAAKDFYTKQFS